MATNNTYSFLDVAAVLSGPGGAVPMSGVAEEGVDIAASGEINTMQVGADGTGQHSLHADKSGRITVRLLKTSAINALLMAMYNLQTSAASLHGQNTLVITDTARGDVITCQQVAFAKAPDLNFAKDAGTMAWEFHAVSIDRVLAGA